MMAPAAQRHVRHTMGQRPIIFFLVAFSIAQTTRAESFELPPQFAVLQRIAIDTETLRFGSFKIGEPFSEVYQRVHSDHWVHSMSELEKSDPISFTSTVVYGKERYRISFNGDSPRARIVAIEVGLNACTPGGNLEDYLRSELRRRFPTLRVAYSAKSRELLLFESEHPRKRQVIALECDHVSIGQRDRFFK